MAQQQWNGPYPAGPSGPPTPPRKSNAVWWVVIAVAAAVLVGVVAWALLRSGTPEPTPTPESPTPTTTTSSTDPGTASGEDWGPFPPANPDDLRDLSDPEFPETLGEFTLESANVDSASGLASYINEEEASVLSAWVIFTSVDYAGMVAEIEDPAYVGSAVCGSVVDEAISYEGVSCVMAGQGETLEVGTMDDITVEELAALVEELYETL